MAYRLRRSENVAEGLHRVMCEEIESAAAALRGPHSVETAVHQARRSIKKVRAVLRLMSPSPKLKGPFGEANTVLRDAARKLSALRDTVVLTSTLDAVGRRFAGDPRAESLGRVRASLVRRRREAEQGHAVARVTGEAAAALDRAAVGAKDWPGLEPGFESIAGGLESTYRQGRTALAWAVRHPGVKSLHELRKRVKDHVYQVRLLEGVWTGEMKAREKDLKAIETRLGDDHNLAVLLETVGKDTAGKDAAGKDAGEDLASLVAGYQKELRDSALAMAHKVYVEKPRSFVRNMRFLWDAWKNEPKAVRKGPSGALNQTPSAPRKRNRAAA